MKIDLRSHVPIYVQIAEGIRAAVAAGVYCPGDALPSLRALALDIQVNPNTVQKAYDVLAREGLIYSRKGRGLFVAEQSAESAQSHAQDTVRRSFDDGIQTGRLAGMTDEQIRTVFSAALGGNGKTRRQKP